MATTAGDVLLAYLGQQLTELRGHAPGVRDNQAESIHQMRVSARRMRALLASGKAMFASGATDQVRTELRWFSGALGAARDPGVVQARLGGLLDAEPADLIQREAVARIDGELNAAGAAGLGVALAALESERYAQLLASAECLLAAPPLSPSASRPPRRTVRRFVARDEARLRVAVAALPPADGEGGAALDAGLHEVRKAAKRLRYSAELGLAVRGDSAGKRARRVARAARRIQTDLGLHQDSVVSRALLVELGLRAPLGGDSGFTYGRLHAQEEHLAARSAADFLKTWRNFPR